MHIHTVPSTLRIEPGHPVDIVVIADGNKIRVSLEWPVIERWLGVRANDPEAVKEALRTRRGIIEQTVQARLIAHGVPLSNELTLSNADFRSGRGY
jgi:hypothetical protein